MNSVSILNCRVDNVNWEDIDVFCQEALSQDSPRHIVTLNGEQILLSQVDTQYHDAVGAADLIIPDSTNIVWVSRWLGKGLKQVTPGSDLTLRLADLAASEQKSIFLLGAKEGIAAKAAEVLAIKFPDLRIAGTSAADPHDQAAVKQIADSRADIVLVAYGAPQHDLWISKNKVATGAKILVGIGGTLDMLAGRLPRAPRFMRFLHLEWLWRLIIQPTRIGRIWNALVVFPFKALLTD